MSKITTVDTRKNVDCTGGGAKLRVPKLKKQYQKLLQQCDRTEMVKSLEPVTKIIADAMVESSRVVAGTSNVLVFLCCGDGDKEAYIAHALMNRNIRIDTVIMMDKTISPNLLGLCDHWRTTFKITMLTSDSFGDLTEKLQNINNSDVNITIHAHNADIWFDGKREIRDFKKFTALIIELAEKGRTSTTMLQSRTLRRYAIEAMLKADWGDVMITNRTHFPGDTEGIAMLIWSTWPELCTKWCSSSERKQNAKRNIAKGLLNYSLPPT